MEGEKFFLGSLEGGDGGGQKGFSLRREKKNFPCRGIRGGRKIFSSAGGYEGGEKPKIWVLPGQGVLFNLSGDRLILDLRRGILSPVTPPNRMV